MNPARPLIAPLAAVALAAAGATPAHAQTPIVPYPTPGAVSVSPAPGVISASTTTQISIRGRGPTDIGPITVTGSRSGRMTGRLRGHSDGAGASWVPTKAFKPRETVTVRTSLPLLATRNGDFSFRVGRFPTRVRIPHVILENIEPGKLDSFRTRPDLKPPLVTVDPNPKPTAPGYVFLTPKSKKDLKQAGPMIVDNRGKPIWFAPLPGIRAATDFRAQTYRGKPVLTYWEGTSRLGIGVGELVIRDQAYRIIRRIRVPNGFRPDLHEFLITPQNTALLITYPLVRTDLSEHGGLRNGLAVDSVIQEIDIATGLVVFEWHSLGNIALAESFTKPEKSAVLPWDYAHTNGVSIDSDGHLLMSARNTWGVYKIDRRTGAIRWRLGGKRSTFRLGRGVRFAWQHDAHRRSDGAITVFDNSAFPPVRKHSRVLALRVDEQAKTAAVISARLHPRRLRRPPRATSRSCPAGAPSSAGDRSATSPNTTAPAASCGTRACRSALRPTAPTGCRGSACPTRARRPSASDAAPRWTCTRAGTAPPRCAPTRCSGSVGDLAGDAPHGRRTASRPRAGSAAYRLHRRPRRNAAGAVLGTSASARVR